MLSTFEEMKQDIESDGWTVLWSESYGLGDAAALLGCAYFGCLQEYLKYKLDRLLKKVGKDFLEQVIRSKGQTLTGPGDLEVQAGDAYWSVYINIWNPLKWRHERVTTERYVRLYLRYRRKGGGPTGVDGKLVTLRANNRQYVCAEGGGGREVVANRDVPRGWETFEMQEHEGSKVSLRANNGQYISAEGGGGREVVANRNAVGPWEMFEIQRASNRVSLRAHNGQYVCAEGGGGRELLANRNVVAGWELFEYGEL